VAAGDQGRRPVSSFGSHAVAPGGESGAGLLSTLNAGSSLPGADSYAYYMGTSMAAPMVSGVAALMLSVNATLTPDQIALLLKSSARPFPALCSGCGAGLVDAHAAVSQPTAAAACSPRRPNGSSNHGDQGS
jgi:serine protease